MYQSLRKTHYDRDKRNTVLVLREAAFGERLQLTGAKSKVKSVFHVLGNKIEVK